GALWFPRSGHGCECRWSAWLPFTARPLVASRLRDRASYGIESAKAIGEKRMKTALLALSVLFASPALAQQDVTDFYRGKTVRIVVGVGVGSGYDINARAIARHLSA